MRPTWLFEPAGPVPYEASNAAMHDLAERRLAGDVPDSLILLEHPPTVTLGRRTADEELHVPEGIAVEVVETNRGGKSTYHAPGQLVCYPILDLTRHGRDVRKYCRDLEEAVSRAPNSANTHYHLGIALTKAGDVERGRKALERALSLNLNEAAAAEARKLMARS